MKIENKYCYICDNKIEEKKIDGIKCLICAECQQITVGYRKEEEYFVKKLREYFSQPDYYMIEAITLILRGYLRQINQRPK